MNLDKVIHAIETEELAREIESLSGNLATDISNLFIRAAKPHKHAAMMKVHDSVRDTAAKIYKTAIDKTLADAQAEVMSNLHAHNTKLGGRMGQRLGQAIKTKPGPNAEAIHGAKPDSAALGGLSGISIIGSGINYVVGDVLTVAGGTLLNGATAATIMVDAVSSNGAILTAHILTYGGWSVLPSTPNGVTGGTGSGAEIGLSLNAPIASSLIFNLYVFTTKFLAAMNTAGRQAYLFTSKGLLSHLGQNETATDSGVVRDFLINRQNKISGCPQIIFDQIMDSLNEGVNGGETMPELAARVQDEFEGISKTRATLISQTESQCCYGMAQLGALDTAGVEKKRWITLDDNKVRPSHQEAEDDGAIDADDEFSNGLRCPGDMDGDASEVCNCRCYLAPAEADEKDLESELSELEDALA